MNEVKWIKIVTDIFNDEKIMLIDSLPEGDTILVIWFKLLCLAGKQNNGGVIMMSNRIAYTDEMLATIFRRNLNTVRLALKTFVEFEMIEIINGAVCISNWSKHQNLESMERVRDLTRNRVAKYREKQKMLTLSESSNVTCNVTDNVTETLGNGIDIDKEKDIDKDKEEEIYICSSDDEQKSISALQEDFEKCWSEYPRKAGKKKAFAAFKRSIKNGATVEDILIGIKYYKEDIISRRLPEQYIKMGSTFFQGEHWTDEYGTTINTAPDYSNERSDVDDIII